MARIFMSAMWVTVLSTKPATKTHLQVRTIVASISGLLLLHGSATSLCLEGGKLLFAPHPNPAHMNFVVVSLLLKVLDNNMWPWHSSLSLLPCSSTQHCLMATWVHFIFCTSNFPFPRRPPLHRHGFIRWHFCTGQYQNPDFGLKACCCCFCQAASLLPRWPPRLVFASWGSVWHSRDQYESLQLASPTIRLFHFFEK